MLPSFIVVKILLLAAEYEKYLFIRFPERVIAELKKNKEYLLWCYLFKFKEKIEEKVEEEIENIVDKSLKSENIDVVKLGIEMVLVILMFVFTQIILKLQIWEWKTGSFWLINVFTQIILKL